MTYKVIVAGGRDFNDYELMKQKLNMLLSKKERVEIVSGGARGADSLGERYAREHKLPVQIIRADWDMYGKSAGVIRNKEMAEKADALVAFWNGKSKGTKHMINMAKSKKLDVRVICY